MKTASTSKQALMLTAQERMLALVPKQDLSDRQKIALTCRILYDHGHDSGLAGQISCRAQSDDRFITQQFGLGFDEITASSLLEVNYDLEPQDQAGMPNPANRFHTWIYQHHPEVNCIIHTHPTHIAALSMIGKPLHIGQMDVCALYEDCAFLDKWPGVPVGNEEGVIISNAIGEKRAILLAHHGQLVVGKTIEEACNLALMIERAAKLQLLAMSAGTLKDLPADLAREAHDWLSTEQRNQVNFAYYSRKALKQHEDCLG